MSESTYGMDLARAVREARERGELTSSQLAEPEDGPCKLDPWATACHHPGPACDFPEPVTELRPATAPQRCPECGGLNGAHSPVHRRYGNGGGANRPCSRDKPGARFEPWHSSRLWQGADHDQLPDCICPAQPCGHVLAQESCPQHGLAAGRTIRRAHRASECPAAWAVAPTDPAGRDHLRRAQAQAWEEGLAAAKLQAATGTPCRNPYLGGP